MDFLKNAADKINSGDKKEGSSSSGESAANKAEGKYDKYVDKGVDYAEQKFMHTDVNNKSDSVKQRDEKIGNFISDNIDKYTNKEGKN